MAAITYDDQIGTWPVSRPIEMAAFDDLEMLGAIMRGIGGGGPPPHRHGGARAHRRWKRARASGRH